MAGADRDILDWVTDQEEKRCESFSMLQIVM